MNALSAHGPSGAISANQARELTDRIKVAVDGTWLLIQEAYTSRAWAALGYHSWDDYCTREFGTSRLRLPREERQEVVASLREIGMSQRAIVAATGLDRKTVRRDIGQVGEKGPPGEDTRLLAIAEARAASDNGQRYPLHDVMRDHGVDPDELDDDANEMHPDHSGPAPQPTPRTITGTDGKTYSAAPSRAPQKPRTDVVATVNRAIQRAQDAARAADEISRQHLTGRTTEAAVWARSLGRSLESLQRLHDLMKETS